SHAYGSSRRSGYLADAFLEVSLVDGEDLGDVYHACLRKVGFALFQKHFARLKFEVIRQTTLVAIALRLKTSFCTTTQGCRSAGAEPAAGPKSSQYTCPCRISL